MARLQRVVEELFPNRGAQLQLFGSSVNGFGVTGSDMDMVLMLEPDPKTDGNDKHPQANLVEKVSTFQDSRCCFFLKRKNLGCWSFDCASVWRVACNSNCSSSRCEVS